MPEVLLRPNLRAIYAGMVLPAALALIGLLIALEPGQAGGWLRSVGWGLAVFGGLLTGLLFWQTRQPRMAYETGHLLLHLRSGAPIRLPVELVQCAFLGASPTQLPGSGRRQMRTSNLVVRLDEKATDWAEVAVKPALGRWEEGYITIHGTWCEPLTLDVVQRLNLRLHELNHPAAAAAAPRQAGDPS